jgi:hypothetical protein
MSTTTAIPPEHAQEFQAWVSMVNWLHHHKRSRSSRVVRIEYPHIYVVKGHVCKELTFQPTKR